MALDRNILSFKQLFKFEEKLKLKSKIQIFSSSNLNITQR